MSDFIDDQVLAQIEAAVTRGGVYVSPGLRSKLTESQLAQIRAARKDTPTSTYVVVVHVDYDDPTYHGNAEALIARLRDDTGRDGLYMVASSQYGGYALTTQAYPDDDQSSYIGSVATDEHRQDLAAMILDGLALARSGDAEERMEAIYDRNQSTATSHSQPHEAGGHAVAVTTGILGAVVVVAGLGIVLRRRTRIAPAVGAATAGRGFALPKAVLSTVRAAEDRQNESRAQADVLALGEAIDAAELKAAPAKVQAAWQAALDHYDVARRILDREHSPADAVGAIVLAGRGRAALNAALARRGWRPSRPCYFNPLHPEPPGTVTWRDGDRSVAVPACNACARSVRSRKEPVDILDFVADGAPRHYFNLDLGVWSQTAYGALDTDLLGRLLTG